MTNHDFAKKKSSPKILVFSGSFLSQSLLVQELQNQFPNDCVIVAEPIQTEAQLIEQVQTHQTEAILVGHEPVGAMTLKQAKSLRVVAKYGVGLDNIDIEAFSRSPVRLFYPQGINKMAVSELVLGFMLNHFRRIEMMTQNLRRGSWQRLESRSLSALTLGIVGFGNIGQCLAGLVKGFGMTVNYYDIADRSLQGAQIGAHSLDYESLLRESDCISFHVPLTPLTKCMFAEKELKELRKQALVINTSRGAVVDHEVLLRAVHAGKIAGYAADVFSVEPLKWDPQYDHPNLYFTPHVGAFSLEARLAMGRFCINALRDFFTEPLKGDT